MKLINAVLVTNVPAPYRIPMWRRVANLDDINFSVIFCASAHIDAQTSPSDYGFPHYFLKGRYKAEVRRFMHCDIGVWFLLNKLKPNVVITTGYIPTFLFAFIWAFCHRVPHIVMTDGTAKSEQSLSWLHRLIRSLVLNRSTAFVGSCEGSSDLFRQYKVREDRIYKSCLCAENERFSKQFSSLKVDFIFCGRFVQHKGPIFAMQVARETAICLGRRISIDFIGQGELESEMRNYAKEIINFVECRFHGYASQSELPIKYASAKIFLFPSEWDPWGVVANEACASGLPVIVSPHAGVAGELVIDEYNGFIRHLNIELWADAAVKLMNDEELYRNFSQNSRKQVAEYNFDNSAKGLTNAIRQAHSKSTISNLK